jgi:AraC-like DNA-binding protein
VRSDPIISALQHREWTLYSKPRGFTRHVLLLTAGSGEVIQGDVIIPVRAPSVTWLHANHNLTLKIRAGASGHLLGVSHNMLSSGFGEHMESASLRYMVDQTFSLALNEREKKLLQHSFSAIEEEVRSGGRASWMILSAHFSLIAVEIWRLSGAEDVAVKSKGGGSSILQRFRQLVEIHFRNHWTIESYAREIGITHDRLHSICTRKLGRKPLELVHERLCHEGKVLLERSTLTIEQIALSLGFKDAAHFSHFFKRRTQLPPSRFRDNLMKPADDARDRPPVTFADWP